MSGRWIVACACLAVAGCGSDQRLEPATAGALSDDVAAVRAAAEEGDRAAALSGLDSLHERIAQAEADGELDDRAAVELRRAVRRAKRRVDQELAAQPPPAAAPEPTATSEPPPAEPDAGAGEEGGGEPGTGNDEHKGEGEAEGKGKEKGKGDDEEGDD